LPLMPSSIHEQINPSPRYYSSCRRTRKPRTVKAYTGLAPASQLANSRASSLGGNDLPKRSQFRSVWFCRPLRLAGCMRLGNLQRRAHALPTCRTGLACGLHKAKAIRWLAYGGNRMRLTRSENRGSRRSPFQRGSRRSQTSQCALSSKALLSHAKVASFSPRPAWTSATP